jgi:HlyD family secretion protein
LLLYLIEIGVAVVVATALALYLLRSVLLGTPTKAYAATRGELVQSVVASGRVISPQRVTVALQGSGRVQRVAVAEGQVVEAGQLLIELDNNDSRASLAQANAATAQARQALIQAEATWLQTRKTLNRNRDLVAQGFISQAAVDDAQRAVDVVASQVASAQAQVQTRRQSGSTYSCSGAGRVGTRARTNDWKNPMSP